MSFRKPGKRSIGWLLLLVLMIPLIAACGETAVPTATVGSTPATGGEPTAAPTTAPTDDTAAATPTEAAAATEEPTMGDADKYLVFGGSGEPDSLDSMDTTTGTALIVTRQIQESLLGFKAGTLEVVPELATKWEPNADATEWTFTLREGVKFSDGTDFNADAVVFNFQRLFVPDFEFGFRAEGKQYNIVPDIFGGYAGDPNSAFKEVVAVDPTTVKFVLTRPVPLLPSYLAASYFGISSPEAVKAAKEKYGSPEVGGVGTGPFKFERWDAGQSITLVRNEDYWGDKAKMPGVVVRFIAEAPQRLAELEAGTIDFTINLSADSRNKIASSADLQVVDLTPFNIAYLSLNMNNKPFDDVRVRQAVAYAINKQEILDASYGGVGSIADDFLPDGLAEYRATDLEPYAYDPEKAKALLAEAGYADGFSTMVLTDGTELPLELWYMPVSRPYYPDAKSVAELYAAQLSDVGIKVELKTEDWGVYLDNWDAGLKNGMVMLGWTGDYGDPNNFLFTHFGPGNADEAGYSNEQVWQLLADAGGASSPAESIRLFQEAGKLINTDLPRIPIVHAPPVLAAKKALQGWVPNPTGGESFAPISITK
ncbi:MAG: ABC transporter substrate-binding protein [Chloroflexi bacterium]|nr:ABC transporter substrate-binding protein [Chloroflexota bacterium]